MKLSLAALSMLAPAFAQVPEASPDTAPKLATDAIATESVTKFVEHESTVAFNYANQNSWGDYSLTCVEGTSQSPINLFKLVSFN